MDIKKYKIAQTILTLAFFGVIVLITPAHLFPKLLTFKPMIFDMTLKNIAVYYAICAVYLSASVIMRSKVNEAISDERHKIQSRNAAYYTLNFIILGMLIGVIGLRILFNFNSLPDYQMIGNVIAIITVIITLVYSGMYFLFLRRN